MHDSDRDIVRRALLSILGRLEGATRAGAEITGGANINQSSTNMNQSSKDERPQSLNSSGGSDNSIVLIVLGQTNAPGESLHGAGAQPADASREMREGRAPANLKSYEEAFESGRRAMQFTHPALERFPLSQEGTAPPAPKTCLMEPGRACIGSGACEIRGY